MLRLFAASKVSCQIGFRSSRPGLFCIPPSQRI
jgi:hypothetical protein